MRAFCKFLAIAVLALSASTAPAQFRGGGPGGFGQMKDLKDPNQLFEFMAKGRPYFLISETRSFREPLTAFAKEQGITNDQITREQFATFQPKLEYYRTLSGSTGQRPTFGGPPPGAFPGGPPQPPQGAVTIAPGQNPLDAIGQWAEADFRRRDQNGDGKLVPEEMSESLRSHLDRWDTDRDGLINLDEYKVYYSARLQMRDGAPTSAPTAPTTIIIEEDYDKRPDVIRVGKLPKDLPKWFTELGGEKDGQVALHAWHTAGKDLEEFKDWDRNDDGFITPEEVLFKQKSATPSLASRGPSSSPREQPSFNRGSSDNTSGESRRPGGFGGFFKKKER